MEEIPYCKVLEQDAERSCGCCMSGGVQGQAGQGSEQSDVIDGVPAHNKGPLQDLQGLLSMQTIL